MCGCQSVMNIMITVCTISLLQSSECIKVQHFEEQHRNFFLGPRFHPTGEGIPLPVSPDPTPVGAEVGLHSALDWPQQFFTIAYE